MSAFKDIKVGLLHKPWNWGRYESISYSRG